MGVLEVELRVKFKRLTRNRMMKTLSLLSFFFVSNDVKSRSLTNGSNTAKIYVHTFFKDW